MNKKEKPKKNYMIKSNLLNFGVDTINLNVELVDEISIKNIDNYSFISYKNINAKEKGFNRTITLKPKKLKEDKNYLKEFLNPNEIFKLQKSSLSNLLKVIDLLEKSPLINKVNHIGRIDFAYDFNKDYEDTLNLHKLLILCHNYEKHDNKNSYKTDIIRTEGYLSSDIKNKRSILKKRGDLEICAYNKEKQLEYFNNPIKTRLEYRFIKNEISRKKAIKAVIKHQLRKFKKILKDDRKNFSIVNDLLSKTIIENYDASNFKSGKMKLSNFLIAYNGDILTRKILVDLYNHSELNGDIDNYLDKFKIGKFKKNPFVLIYKTQFENYTKLLKQTIINYEK